MGHKTQCQKVLRHIRRYGFITTWVAIQRYGITRVGARIWDIEHKMGIPTDSRLITRKGKTYARYSLA